MHGQRLRAVSDLAYGYTRDHPPKSPGPAFLGLTNASHSAPERLKLQPLILMPKMACAAPMSAPFSIKISEEPHRLLMKFSTSRAQTRHHKRATIADLLAGRRVPREDRKSDELTRSRRLRSRRLGFLTDLVSSSVTFGPQSLNRRALRVASTAESQLGAISLTKPNLSGTSPSISLK